MEIYGIQLDFSTDEVCVGCGDEVFLIASEDGTASVQCGCSSATVLSAA